MSGSLSTRLPVILAVFLCACFSYAEPPDIPDRPPPLTFEEHVDYVAWYNEFVRRGRDEKDNAYPLYLKLCPDKDGKGGFPKPEGKAAEQFEKAVGRVWTKEEFPELAAYLDECKSYLKSFRRALKRPHCWIPVDDHLEMSGSVPLPVLLISRNLTKATMRLIWMKQDNQIKSANASFRDLMRHARHMDEPAPLIHPLVALACRQMISDQVLAMLDCGLLKNGELRTYKALSWDDQPSTILRRSLIHEWAGRLERLQYAIEKGGPDPAKWASNRELVESLGYNFTTNIDQLGFTLDLERARRRVELESQTAVQYLDAGRERELETSLIEIEKEQTEGLSIEEIMSFRLFLGSPLSSIRYLDLVLRERARLRGTRVVLALHVHYAKHGKWPKSLKAIDKKLGLKGLKKIIIDPYSDKRFIYKLKDGRPLLYSVGVDGKDDGGVHHSKFGDGATGPADFVFWPYQKMAAK